MIDRRVCTLARMPADEALLPRARGEIDNDLAKARQDLKDTRRRRTLAIAVYCAAVMIEAFLIIMGVLTSKQGGGWSTTAGVAGFILFFATAFFLTGLTLDTGDQFDISRATLIKKRTTVEQLIIERRESLIGKVRGRTAVYARYREAMPDLVTHYRNQANKYRLFNNALQTFVIIASLAASAVAGLLGATPGERVFIVAITLATAIASSMGSFFRLRERASQLQKTADLIEIEFRAVELGIDDYDVPDRTEALRIFVTKVEKLRSEHMMRQRQLDQPADLRYIDVSSISIDRQTPTSLEDPS
jgi:hypothetical protein